MTAFAQFLQSTTGDVALLVRAATANTEDVLRLVSDHGVRCDVSGPEARAAVASLVSANRNLWVACPFAWNERVLAGGDAFGVEGMRSWLVAARVIAPGAEVLPHVASFGAALGGLPDSTRRWVDEAVAEDLFWRGVSAKGLRVDRGELARVMQRKQGEVDACSRVLGFDLLSGGSTKVAAWLRGYGVKIGDSLDDVKAENVSVAGSTMPSELWAAFTAAARPLSQVYALHGFAKHLRDDVVFPQYKVNSASTGRMSATKPAIQNLTSDGRCIILAPAGRELFSADHASAEIAVLAACLGDPDLATRDIYKEVADVMGTERKEAKPAVLAWLYGQRTAARAALLGSESAAVAFEFAVGKVLPDVVQFRKSLENRVLRGEQIFTLYGRPLPFLGRDSYKALNLVVQGSARDAFGVACRNVAAAAGENFLELLIPMHDEIICSVPAGSDAAAVTRLLTNAMGVVLPGGLVVMRSDVEFLGARWGARRL